MTVTAIIEQGENGWLVGHLKEFPEVIDQGKTIEELQQNLLDGLAYFMEIQRELDDERNVGRVIVQELRLVA